MCGVCGVVWRGGGSVWALSKHTRSVTGVALLGAVKHTRFATRVSLLVAMDTGNMSSNHVDFSGENLSRINEIADSSFQRWI